MSTQDTNKATAELIKLGATIREYQTRKKLSDSALARAYPALGSTRTYTRVLAGDVAELDVEKHLANYRSVAALIEALGDDDTATAAIYDDLSPALALRRAFLDTMKETGNARFILVSGDTGLGKTCAARALGEKFGRARVVYVEASEAWNDKPGAFLSAIFHALGMGEPPSAVAERLDKVIARLCESRVCLVIDEMHHMGPRCLNTVKTLVNQTPGEFIGLTMPTLWARLFRTAYEESRQLTGNRLADHIRLVLAKSDVKKLTTRALGIVPPAEVPEAAVKQLMEKAPRYGNFAFIRDVLARMDKADIEDMDAWQTAIAQEVQSR